MGLSPTSAGKERGKTMLTVPFDMRPLAACLSALLTDRPVCQSSGLRNPTSKPAGTRDRTMSALSKY